MYSVNFDAEEPIKQDELLAAIYQRSLEAEEMLRNEVWSYEEEQDKAAAANSKFAKK